MSAESAFRYGENDEHCCTGTVFLFLSCSGASDVFSFPPSFVFSNMFSLTCFFSLFDTEVLFLLVSLVGWCQFSVCVYFCAV